uniref:proteasome activator complex subunit 3-like n=1 Tax=Ciona intestinalis TaxID=7719 RepID=UPI00052138DD|nr:proteasome activator complex subunit 3-like [Ciona intestinalis]|eukprot:XP_009859369.1 proteasome activator complex subunit 3-like [Ciona intestinalis]
MEYVENFTEEISREAENILHNVFPEKVAQLDRLLRDPRFSLKKLDEIRRVSRNTLKANSAKNSDSSASHPEKLNQVGVNTVIAETMDLLRQEITSVMESCNTLRLWVTLMLPKIEDGNNFGVSVQEETLGEIKGVESEATSYFGQITTYFLARAKICAKLSKHPNIYDYHRYIVEDDEKTFVSLRLMVAELRNAYSSLHDLILKNFDKIRKPRSSSSSYNSMY